MKQEVTAVISPSALSRRRFWVVPSAQRLQTTLFTFCFFSDTQLSSNRGTLSTVKGFGNLRLRTTSTFWVWGRRERGTIRFRGLVLRKQKGDLQ